MLFRSSFQDNNKRGAIMGYRLRFVQHFDKKDSEAFLRLEKKFMELEHNESDLVAARRFVPVSGKLPTNTLIWEADFPTMAEVTAFMETLEQNVAHDELLEQQILYMTDYYVEILKELL